MLLFAGLLWTALPAPFCRAADRATARPAENPTQQPAEALSSGRQAGETVPQFYVHAVTGPLMNKSVCYVCRNGGRPVVMILLRELRPELTPLLKDVDQIVDAHRAAGLRSFAVFLSEEPKGSLGIVQTFAFDHKIAMPMTLATESVAAPDCQNVHPDAAATVVLYRNREVVTTFAFRADELEAGRFREVIERVHRFAEE